jgi:DNA-binding NtrC family response regulator
LNAFKISLPRSGFVISPFVSIIQGFEALKMKRPQVLILDIQLLEPQSVALLREARKFYPTLPIIATTAYSTSFTEADAIRNGANGYFVKPFDLDALIQQLKAAVKDSKEIFSTEGGYVG